jgi:alanyl-tRNA synthetase
MGNFSFGDYFKDTAIPMAWEFFTDVLGLDPERLWITVHLSDDEAEEIWANDVGVPRERIQRLDEDNWWRMADTGPNGPCSEIFWDKGPAYGPEGGPANPAADERYVEIWNLVFMQFETDEAGNTSPLPKPSIDTGAGLERILSVLQQKDSVFEIDEMVRLTSAAEAATGVSLGTNDATDLALRVLAEHARTMTFLISDGVFPSNEDRGYVLRRIMRRAIRFAYLLGVNEIVAPKLVDAVVEIMGPDYPELIDSHDLVRSVVEREEQQFRRTLANGVKILDDHLTGIAEGSELPGSTAFLLHDTYGFPYEVTEEVAAERGYSIDRAGFDVAMAEQRQRAKDARKTMGTFDTLEDLLSAVADLDPKAGFVRDDDQLETQIYFHFAEVEQPYIVLMETPFYAESGGQIGDTGMIMTTSASAKVIDTRMGPGGIHLHYIEDVEGSFEPGQSATATVDGVRRDAIRRNHTGTHVLHWALREVLGGHVKQQGSMVAPDRLRFDFSHFEPVTDEQINQIEDLVNAEVLQNPAADHPEVTKAEAEAMGAIAFFGDKYGDLVRVLRAGPSLEFCGGTHVSALGDIGLLKIVSEGSIGSNLRRVEAVTGTGAIDLLRFEQQVVDRAASALNVPRTEVADTLDKRLAEIKDLKDELNSMRRQLAIGQAGELASEAVGGVVVSRVDDLDRDALKDLAIAIRDVEGVRAVVLAGAPTGGGAALIAAVRPDSGLEAGVLIADAAKAIKGGGGKGADVAMAGGKDPAGLDEALSLARTAAGI